MTFTPVFPPQMSLCTLKLLDSLLLKSDSLVFDALLLRYLSAGGYKSQVQAIPNTQVPPDRESHTEVLEQCKSGEYGWTWKGTVMEGDTFF